jgi:hypothetical protein
MKKYIATLMMVLGGVSLFTSCDDDRDSNPVIQQPSTFVLNTPAYASSLIDLAHSETVNFTWSQPDYGFPVVASYYLQISTTGTFTHSVDEADADETGATVADYASMESVAECQANYVAVNFNKALMQLNQWNPSEVPSELTVYARILSQIPVSGGLTSTGQVISNTIQLNVAPYYVELSNADPEMWYLIGACIGDGNWSNSLDAIGTSMFPMSHIEDYEYDAKTGQGELTFTGWLTPDGFKLVKTPGSWDEQWGSSDGGTTGVKNDGGSSNICVPTAGYYTINLDTKNDKLTITPYDGTPKSYSTMGWIGDFNDWGGDEVMTPFTADNNHLWSVSFTTSGDAEGKFRADGAWDDNWGAEGFPYGFGQSNGANIPVKAGSYTIVFNDIDHFYYFIEK